MLSIHLFNLTAAVIVEEKNDVFEGEGGVRVRGCSYTAVAPFNKTNECINETNELRRKYEYQIVILISTLLNIDASMINI